MSEHEEPPVTLAAVAKARARQRDALWEEVSTGAHPELRPLDDLEQARLAKALVATLPAQRRPRRWVAWAAPALAAAAASVLLVVGPQPDPLPSYTLSVWSGDQAVRSAEPAAPTHRYSQGSRVELVLQPAAPVESEVEVTLEARGPKGEVVPLDWPVQRGKKGALRIVTFLGPELYPGEWVVVIELGRGAQRLQQVIHVEGPP